MNKRNIYEGEDDYDGHSKLRITNSDFLLRTESHEENRANPEMCLKKTPCSSDRTDTALYFLHITSVLQCFQNIKQTNNAGRQQWIMSKNSPIHPCSLLRHLSLPLHISAHLSPHRSPFCCNIIQVGLKVDSLRYSVEPKSGGRLSTLNFRTAYFH